MELWRVLGATALGIGGLLLVLVAMAQARDSALPSGRRDRHDTSVRVARTAMIGVSVVTMTVLLVLTVLPQFAVWALTAAVWLILITLFLSG
ncbi:MAG TPA: hypothetical protein VGJ95_22115 [Pseudonocardiaceae bacterium]